MAGVGAVRMGWFVVEVCFAYFDDLVVMVDKFMGGGSERMG